MPIKKLKNYILKKLQINIFNVEKYQKGYIILCIIIK